MSKEPARLRRLVPQDALRLGQLFAALAKSNAHETFHPHPLDAQTASDICQRRGKDFYGVLPAQSVFLGYGMLRGFDQGYDVPSLGMAIHPNFRGQGLGALLMRELHEAAIKMGAKSIRLKVYPANTHALKLYRRSGYVFASEENGQMVGVCDLS